MSSNNSTIQSIKRILGEGHFLIVRMCEAHAPEVREADGGPFAIKCNNRIVQVHPPISISLPGLHGIMLPRGLGS